MKKPTGPMIYTVQKGAGSPQQIFWTLAVLIATITGIIIASYLVPS
jgi:flagellar biogenesis protein FliO